MAEVQSMIKNVVNESETVLNRALDNVYISTGLKIFIGLYAAFAAPQLPKTLVDLMDNIFMRIGVAFLIVFLATRDKSIALLVAIAFIVTLQQANKLRLYDTSLSVSAPGETSWLPSVTEETSDVNDVQMPGEVVNNVSENTEMSVPTGNMLESEAKESNLLNNGVTENDKNIARASIPSETVHDVIENMVPSQVEGVASNAAPYESTDFTKDEQFTDAQNNNVPGSNQESCVGAFNEQYCAQGLEQNTPNSFNGNELAEF